MNALQRINLHLRQELDALRQEVNGLRQQFQGRGGDAATPGRQEDPAVTQARERLERARMLADLDKQMQELDLDTKIQKLEAKRLEAELNREMSQATTGFNLVEKGNRAAENQTR